MDAVSSSLTIKALDGLFTRAAVTADNIANAGTPRFLPSKVTFEQALAAAAGRGPDAVKALKPKIERDVRPIDDPGLRLDLELATSSSTTMRYAALIDVLNRQLQMQALAITGNS